jgi:hypothetical protein
MNLRTVAALFKEDVLQMFNRWNEDKPLRTGFPHASNILAPDHSFCMRQLVLAAHYPDECVRPETKWWDTEMNARFKHGWIIHEKYQDLFLKYGRVVYFNGNHDKPELDYSHFDDTRLLWFSPDAILEVEGESMVVEIKGYKSDLLYQFLEVIDQVLALIKRHKVEPLYLSVKELVNALVSKRSSTSFESMEESGPAPVDAHNQVNLYMHLLGLKHGLILVENKNTQQIKTWCVEYDKELVQPYLDRIRQFRVALHKLETKQELPERICKTAKDRNAEKCLSCQCCFSRKG